MKPRLLALLLAVVAGCVSAPNTAEPEQSASAVSIVGESGDPRNRARAHTELAALYYGRGSMGVAMEELRTAIAADQTYAPAHSMLGLVYMDLKEIQLAQQSFNRALSHAPTDPDINHNYGWFLCQTGKDTESIRYFLQAIRNPYYTTPWKSYSAAGQCALKKDNIKDAAEYFERTLKLNPDEPVALLNLGDILYRTGKLVEARRLVADFNKLVEPTAESLWLALRIERKLGERVAENSFANQLRRRYPDSREYRQLQRADYE